MPTEHAILDVPLETLDARGIKNHLYYLLGNLESGGAFATSGVHSKAPLPGLSLHGFGRIPLPLAERDADAICREPTDVDQGPVPQVDKSVHRGPGRDAGKVLHNQWEMKPENLDIPNPAWNEFVQGIAIKAAEDMGIREDARAVRAELDSARLWAVQACLTPYKDTPNVVGCFGKLLICLPMARQGGGLLVTYGEETKNFLTESSCAWSYSYIAWYNDATVEFTPLGSGYRLMLEYDLILPSPAKLPSPAHISNEKNKLRGLLAAWNDRVEKDASLPTLLAYICDSYYTSQSLSLNVLQDNDRLRAACLEDLYTQLGIGLCIADLDRTRSGFCGFYPNRYDYQHDIETEDLNEIILTNIVDLDGNTVGGGFSIEEDKHFIQSEPFDEVPDEKDFKSGGIVTYYHRRTGLVLIPSVAKAQWFPEESTESRSNKRKRSVEVIDLQ